MSDKKKLEKQVARAHEAVAARRVELDSAIFAYANAVAIHAIAQEQLEQLEALEAARELRGRG